MWCGFWLIHPAQREASRPSAEQPSAGRAASARGASADRPGWPARPGTQDCEHALRLAAWPCPCARSHHSSKAAERSVLATLGGSASIRVGRWEWCSPMPHIQAAATDQPATGDLVRFLRAIPGQPLPPRGALPSGS